jgi:hypothetical protein
MVAQWLAGVFLFLCPAIALCQPSIGVAQISADSIGLRLTVGQMPSLYSVQFAPSAEALMSHPAVLTSGVAQSVSTNVIALPISTDVPMMFFRVVEAPLTPNQLTNLTDTGSVQTVSMEGVSMTVPAGTLTAPATAAVVGRTAAEAGIPPVSHGLETFQVFDIQIGNETRFNQDLTLELPYDPARLNPDLPVEDALVVSYWLPESKSWKSVPLTVDPNAGVVRFSTPHLSTWAVRYIARGWQVLKSDNLHARVVFDPTQPVFRGKSQKVPVQDYAQLIADAGEAAYSAYKTAGFIVPEEQWYIILNAAEEGYAFWSGWTGDVYLPSVFDDDEWVRYTVGHELFHSVQNAYYNIYSASGRQWWHEACATYASWHYVLNRDYPLRTPDIKTSDYPALPVSTANGSHEYVTAELLAFIFARSGLTFKAHFDDMEGYGISSTLKRLEQTVSRLAGSDLHRFYRLFCGDYWLNRAGVLPNFNPLLDPDGNLPLFFASETSKRFDFALAGGYTGKLAFWEVLSDTASRELTVEARGINGKASLDVYVVPNFLGQGNVSPKGTLLKAGDKLDVTVPANHFLVLVGINYDASVQSSIGGFIKDTQAADVSIPFSWTEGPGVDQTLEVAGNWRLQGALYPPLIRTNSLSRGHSVGAFYSGDIDDTITITFNCTPTVTPASYQYEDDGFFGILYVEWLLGETNFDVHPGFTIQESSSGFGGFFVRLVQTGALPWYEHGIIRLTQSYRTRSKWVTWSERDPAGTYRDWGWEESPRDNFGAMFELGTAPP